MTVDGGKEVGVLRGKNTRSQGVEMAGYHRADYRVCAVAVPAKNQYARSGAKLPNALLLSFSCLLALAVTGCSSPRPQLGAIAVTDSNGKQASSVVVNATVNVTVSVANDGANLGVDWNLNCGGSPLIPAGPEPCGTLNPLHVGSNISMVYTAPAYVPIGNTVTLTATATSDPSVTSTVALTISPEPITIAFNQVYLPPAQMATKGTVQLAATVTNDPIAAGVSWSCAPAGSCGSFNPVQTASASPTTYIAPGQVPSGSVVTITATSIKDSARSVAAKVQIMPITVAVTASPSTTGIHGGATLTANVAWDSAGAGVRWPDPLTCSFGSKTYSGATDCGSIGSNVCTPGVAPNYAYTCTAAYTAPLALPVGDTALQVKATATSIADPSDSGSVAITIGPPPKIVVKATTANGALQINGSTTVTATVDNDYTNSGVTWQCSPGSCSQASPFTATYSAPSTATGPATAKATSNFCIQNPADSQCTNDPQSSGTVNIAIDPAISVAVKPPAAGVTAGTPATFSATVTNDIGHAGVTWSSVCTVSLNCGNFTATKCTATDASTTSCTASFTALNNLPWNENPVVTVRATSAASVNVPPLVPNPNTSPGPGISDPVQVQVTPVTYMHFVPYPPSVLPVTNPSALALVNLIAVAANDSTNKGVDWSVCSSASTCGTFQVSPAYPPTLKTPAGIPAVYSHTIHVPNGQAVSYLPPTSVPSSCSSSPTSCKVTITAASTAEPATKVTATIEIENGSSGFTGPALTGTVVAGNVPSPGVAGLPISGASVQLLAAGSECYGSAYGAGTCPAANDALPLSNGQNSVTTASDGSFTIPAGYSCTPGSLLYLVSSGGMPQGQSTPNSLLYFLTALGPCESLNSTVPVVMNEVTTVVSAFALAPFTGGNFLEIGASSTNYNNPGTLNYNNGLANAFATVNNLVDITTGQVFPVTPAGYGKIPQAEIYTLADAMDTCAVTSGFITGLGDGSACDLYLEASNVNPPLGQLADSTNSPANIQDAIVEVAQRPGNSGIAPSGSVRTTAASPIYYLVTNPVNSQWQPPFTDNLISDGLGVPNDWSIALSFTGGGLEGAGKAQPGSTAMAIDGSGNIWITNGRISTVTELSNLGAALSPFATGSKAAQAGGFSGGGLLTSPEQIAIDPIGNAWVLNNDSSLTELNFSGEAVKGSPFSGAGTAAANGMAIDPSGNIWVTDSGSPGDVGEYAGYNDVLNGKQKPNGTPISPSGGYPIAVAANPNKASADPNGAIAIDANGDVWVLDGGQYLAVELSSTGQLLDTDCGDKIDPTSGVAYNPPQCYLPTTNFGISMAIDSAGDLFVPDDDPGENTPETTELVGVGSTYQNHGGYGAKENPPDDLYAGGVGKQISYGAIPGPFTPIAIDGAGSMWQVTPANTSSPSPGPLTVELSASGAILNTTSSNTVDQNQGFMCGAAAQTTSSQCPMLANGDAGIAVDASGNLWVLTAADSSSVTEFIGVATPVVTPLSAGKPGKKP